MRSQPKSSGWNPGRSKGTKWTRKLRISSVAATRPSNRLGGSLNGPLSGSRCVSRSSHFFAKFFSYQATDRSIRSTLCFGSRIPWPSRGYRTKIASTPTSRRAM